MIDIDQDRKIMLSEEITRRVASDTAEALIVHAEHDPDLPIQLWINTPGGVLLQALAIIDVMRSISPRVETIGLGTVQSCGIALLAAGEEDHRYCFPSTRLLLHGVSFNPPDGDSIAKRDLEGLNTEIDTLQELFLRELTRQSSHPRSWWEKILNSGLDEYLSAHEAQEVGLMDHIIGVDCTIPWQ